jgi:cellobiose-specific phosphotransferase system component IIB
MSNSLRNKVMHSREPSVYTGDYQVTDAALKNYNVVRDKFGTTDINLPQTTFNVKNYQYVLDNGTVGMHLIPVNDYGIINGPSKKTFWASQLIDSYIREKTNIKPTDPLYAFMYYIHPELSEISISDFSTTDIFEMGITHMGAYYGQGLTTNSPPLYHHRRWGVAGPTLGYPCNVLTISMKNVDQAVLNKNFILADKFINYGVRFPIDYKHSAFRMIDINTCLMFYKDWIMEKDYLKNDPSWFTYCAAHKTLVTTVALNLPHNEKSFMEIYGEKEGKAFFEIFKTNYFELAGERFIEDDKGETNFEPLWKKEGLTPAQIKPFTHEEYVAYDTARREGKLKGFKGFRPLKPTQATGWGPQLAADVIMNFVESYADFLDAGAIISCATIMGYSGEITVRMGISMTEYLMSAMPIVETYMHANAMIYAPTGSVDDYDKSTYYKETFEGLYIAYGGSKEGIINALKQLPALDKYEGDLKGFVAFLQSQDKILPEFLAWWSLWKVRVNWLTIIAAPNLLPLDAYAWLQIAVKEKFEAARAIVAPETDAIQYNTPPAIGHMIGIGMFDKNPLITLKTICTVMDHTELEPKP